MVGKVCVHGRHQMEPSAIMIIPYLLIDRPEVFLVHYFAECFDCRDSGRTIFRVEAIDTATAFGCCILVVLHRVYLFVRAAVVHAVTFRLHLVTACPVQFHDQVFCSWHFRAFIRRNIVGQ